MFKEGKHSRSGHTEENSIYKKQTNISVNSTHTGEERGEEEKKKWRYRHVHYEFVAVCELVVHGDLTCWHLV